MPINCTGSPPPDMSLNPSILSIVLCYCLVFLIALIGNGTMFLILLRNQLIKVRRVHSLLLHMNIAHLMVTLLYMPKEILHQYMVAWHGGDLLCRLCKFFDVFGIALSMNILICISLDRFQSIFFPLYAMKARKSVQKMVTIAWLVSFVTSAPQIYLFKTATHPCHPSYTQCVSKNFIGELSTEVVFYFSILNIIQVYFLPLVITVLCYSLILWKISKKRSENEELAKNDMLLRRNGVNTLERARSRTLKMTFIIVLAFIFCWTPYAILMFLHFLTETNWIPKDLRKFIYAFAVFNSAISPYLYGYFSFDVRKELRMLISCSKLTASDRNLSCSANVSSAARYRNSMMQDRLRKRSASAFEIESTTDSTRLLSPALQLRGSSMRQAKRPITVGDEVSNNELLCATPNSQYRSITPVDLMCQENLVIRM